jgi:hypothetical protein
MKTLLTGTGITVVALVGLLALALSARAETEPAAVDIVVSPSSVFLDSQGTWVTVHAEIAYSAVVGATVTLDGIPVVFTKADNRGEFVAKFDLDQVKSRLEPGTVTLTLFGETKDGGTFVGSDEITVRDGGRK